MNRLIDPKQQHLVRCAIYTRKSTEEGLDQEFNSLDAQREAAEAYIKSQTHAGWQAMPETYDDGGFSGGNIDRPALKRMMRDIAAGLIDCVVVYKVDRLSRSLTDFSKILETFDRFNVAFVSVTQQFNTASSMGRLILNVLLSFAQFEREIISERTRDKMAATRRKGKWAGGLPMLGYDVEPGTKRLVVNEHEAQQVRTIFELYLKHRSLLDTTNDLFARGWTTKLSKTRKGTERGGCFFTKTNLHDLLTNVIYIGQIRHKNETHPGEHERIIPDELWQRVQCQLERNGRSGGAGVRNQFGAILKGKLHCVPCNCAMTPSHSTCQGKRYRYYVCVAAQKRGWTKCPSKSIPAGEIEKFVVEQIRKLANDPDLITETVAATRTLVETEIAACQTELKGIQNDLQHWNAEIRQQIAHVGPCDASSPVVERLAELETRCAVAQRRALELKDQRTALEGKLIDEHQIRHALELFDPVWESLTTREQVRVIELLIDRVDYDGEQSKVTVTFHPQGLNVFAQEFAGEKHEVSA